MNADKREELVRQVAEHDAIYPPKKCGEPPKEFLERALKEHRESHASWVGHCDGHAALAGDAYQQRAVERYDEMLAALREMYSLARAETAKEVIEAAAKVVEDSPLQSMTTDPQAKTGWSLPQTTIAEVARRIRALASRYAEGNE